jgi:hypothetical protein
MFGNCSYLSVDFVLPPEKFTFCRIKCLIHVYLISFLLTFKFDDILQIYVSILYYKSSLVDRSSAAMFHLPFTASVTGGGFVALRLRPCQRLLEHLHRFSDIIISSPPTNLLNYNYLRPLGRFRYFEKCLRRVFIANGLKFSSD